MSPNIRIDPEVYKWLQDHAVPFVDTPNDILRRLVGLDREETTARVSTARQRKRPNRGLQNGTLGTRDDSRQKIPARLDTSQLRDSSQRSTRRSRRRKGFPRAPAGTLLPEDEYVVPLLSVLAECGGTTSAREVIEAVGRRLENRLAPADREKTASGVIRWQNRTQFVRLKLVEEGLLARDSGRGIWSLTDAGRAKLKDLLKGQPTKR